MRDLLSRIVVTFLQLLQRRAFHQWRRPSAGSPQWFNLCVSYQCFSRCVLHQCFNLCVWCRHLSCSGRVWRENGSTMTWCGIVLFYPLFCFVLRLRCYSACIVKLFACNSCLYFDWVQIYDKMCMIDFVTGRWRVLWMRPTALRAYAGGLGVAGGDWETKVSDVWRVTCGVWRVTCDVWRVTCDT